MKTLQKFFLLVLLIPQLALAQQNFIWSAYPGNATEKTFILDGAWTGNVTATAYAAAGGRVLSLLVQPSLVKTGTTLVVSFSAFATRTLSGSTYLEIATAGTVRFKGYLTLSYSTTTPGSGTVVSGGSGGSSTITSSSITDFTSAVRALFTAGTNINISSGGVISATGGGSGTSTWSGLTGQAPNVSVFPNNLGYQTAGDVASAISASGGGSGSGGTDVLGAKYTGASWAALGTSITADGYYTSQLATLSGMTLTNLGISGSTWGGTNATTPGPIYNAAASIPTGTKVVTLEGMMNDWGFGIALGAANDTTFNTAYGASYRLARQVKTALPSATVYIIGQYTVNWVGYSGLSQGGYLNSAGVSAFQMNEAMRQAANRTGCIFIDVTESGIGIPTSAINMRDNLHLSVTGAKKYADLVWQRMRQYNIDPTNSGTSTTVATPVFSPGPNTYTGSQNVTITDGTAGATIYFTTDGSTPTTASTVYSSAIAVTTTTTIKSIAVKSGMTASAVATGLFTITNAVATPSFSPAAGSYTGNQTIAASTTTSGATLYYTTNGTDPTTSSTVYSTPITLTAPGTTTLKVLAVKAGLTNSSIGSATYTLSSGSSNVTYPNPIVSDNGYSLSAVTSADLSSVNVSSMAVQSDGSITGTLGGGFLGAIFTNRSGANNAIQMTLADLKSYGPNLGFSKGSGGGQVVGPTNNGQALDNGALVNNAGNLTAFTISPAGANVGNSFAVGDKFRIRGSTTSVVIDYKKVGTTTWIQAWSGNPSTQSGSSTHAGSAWLGFAFGFFDGYGTFKEHYSGTYVAP